jgi:hypothetical protein
MKIGTANVGWTEALLLAKEEHLTELKASGALFAGVRARLGAIGSVLGQGITGQDETLKKAMDNPSNVIGLKLSAARSAVAGAVQGVTGGDGVRGAMRNAKNKIGEKLGQIGRGFRKLRGKETIGDRAQEQLFDPLKGVANAAGEKINELTGGKNNIKEGFGNLWKFIRG